MGNCCISFRVNELSVDKALRVDDHREHVVEDRVAAVFRFGPTSIASTEDTRKQFVDQREPIAFVGAEGLNSAFPLTLEILLLQQYADPHS